MAGSMQYKSNLKIRLGILNIGVLSGNGLEICEKLWKSRFVLLTRGEMESMWS